MALEKEIWLPMIKEGLFPDNSFLSKATNLSAFVEGKTVHVPNVGAAPNIVKNRSTFPATVGSRTDTDLTFNIDEYTTDPIKIANKEKIELSYDKRQSVIGGSKNKLINSVSEDVLYNWANGGAKILETTGDETTAHTPGATGSRKGVCRGDILAASTEFNQTDVPAEGRFFLLDAVMYNQLLNDLTEADKAMLAATADLSRGIIGQLLGFNLLMRSRVCRLTGSKNNKAWETGGAATDLGAGLAWQSDCVGVAQGAVEMFEEESNPLYYGDIFSFLVRAGGHISAQIKAGFASWRNQPRKL